MKAIIVAALMAVLPSTTQAAQTIVCIKAVTGASKVVLFLKDGRDPIYPLQRAPKDPSYMGANLPVDIGLIKHVLFVKHNLSPVRMIKVVSKRNICS